MERETVSQLDSEWAELIKEAILMGMTNEEIRNFLRQKSKTVSSA
ncbi:MULTISPECIES: anti-repressor SinI family protein [Bacillaceae]|uniref:Anti-repressor SinI family protein n=1 Tax=Evansella alkalicola TaxID=745819 RepID=A0ABS6JVN7_9BACI|nr:MULTISPECIES: anti-repressor SinI family protein [Bacillaceae]MBU9722455.1 anti-repressor SinI family protein [Bacillus alkalicola]